MFWTLVAPLSATQLVSWGSLIYAFALFVEPMGREFGWSKAALSAAYSLGLLASALGAIPAGRLIDRGHGRLVLTAGSVTAALSLALWSRAGGYPAFLAAWLGIGLAMSATLYEPGFAVLARSLGPQARRGITVMALVGGLASTLFLPLTHWLIGALGWRGALLGLAALNLGCALVHLLAVPHGRGAAGRAETGPAPPGAGPGRVLREPAFRGFVLVVVLHSALLSGFIVHLIPILVERGTPLEVAVAAFALFGPAQVGARLAMGLGGRRLPLSATGLCVTALLAAAFLLLALAPPGPGLLALFCLLFGAANGAMTLVRAMLPAELFGPADYGLVQGMIAMPATLARAAGPFLLAAVWSWTGATGPVLGLGFGLALASACVFALAVAPARGRAGPA